MSLVRIVFCMLIISLSFSINAAVIGNHIVIDVYSSSAIPKNLQELFERTFRNKYDSLSPQLLNPDFTSKRAVHQWIHKVFLHEISNYYTNSNIQIVILSDIRNHTIIGSAIIEVFPRYLYIRHLVVDPGLQRQGYGSILLAYLEKELVQAKQYIAADTRIINTSARQFYIKNGYNRITTPHDSNLNSELYIGFSKY